MDQEIITTEAPGIDSGADTSTGITTEAELANSFLERVEEQPEEKPTETEATDDSDAEAEEDREGNVLSPFGENIDYFSVAERFGRVFLLDDGANQFLDARVGHEVSVLTDVSVGEKVLEGEDPVRSLYVLA